MPLVDRRSDTVVLRIVYDGPPEAGKTTNVRELCERISLNRRGELSSPGNQERTQFFDWLEVAGGYVQGRRIRCQLVSVPGQPELLRRRRYLLESADAVVFVADARPDALALNQKLVSELLTMLLKTGGERPARVVLQANKQDLEGALDPTALREKLSLDPETSALAAQACHGVGVLETLTVAVRLAVERVRGLVLSGTALDEREVSEEPEDLLRALRAIEQSAVELLAGPTVLPVGSSNQEDMPVAALTLKERPVEPEPVVKREIESPSTEISISVLPASDAESGGPRVATNAAPEAPAKDTSRGARFALPHADIPPGFVWPPMEGRNALREIATMEVLPWDNLPWASAHTHALRFGDAWLAETSESDCYADVDAARHALLARIQHTLALGPLAPKARVLTIASETGGEGRAVLWTLTRGPRPLFSELVREAGQGARAMCKRAVVALDALAQLHHQEQLKQVFAEAGVDGLVAQAEGFAYAGPVARGISSADLPTRIRVLAQRIGEACVDLGFKEDVALELSAARGGLTGALSEAVDVLVSRLSEDLHPSIAPRSTPSVIPRVSQIPTIAPHPPVHVVVEGPAALSLSSAEGRLLVPPSHELVETRKEAEADVRCESEPTDAIVEERSTSVIPLAELELEVPPEDVPSGFVWPPVLGRAALSGFAEGRTTRALSLAPWAPRSAVELRSDAGLIAHTTPGWCFDDRDAARAHLAEQVRKQMWFSDFVPTRRAFAVGQQGERFRAWVLTPSLTSVRQAWSWGLAANDTPGAAERVVAILRTLIDLSDLPFDGHVRPRLEHLAIQHGRVVYLGIPGESDVLEPSRWCHEIAEAFQGLCKESPLLRGHLPGALEAVSKGGSGTASAMVEAVRLAVS